MRRASELMRRSVVIMPSTSVHISMRSASAAPGPNDRCRIVRAASTDRGGDSGFRGADEPSHDRDFARCHQRRNFRVQALIGFFK